MFFYQLNNSKTGVNNDIHIFKNFNFLTHMHRDLELTFVLEGEIDITVENQVYHAKEGDMALIFSNQTHAYSSPSDSRVLIHVFSPDNVRSFIHTLNGKVGQTPIFHCDKIVQDFYYECLMEKNIRSSLAIKSYLYIICDQYLSAVPLVNEIKNNDNILHTMLHYISDHFNEDISLVSISEALGYEPHYLSRIFSSGTGINLRHYINQYRVDYAKYRLSESDSPITEIALSSGFGSIRNFNRVFVEYENITPSKYRQNTSKKDISLK